MAIAWMIVPYKVRAILGGTQAARYCALVDFQTAIDIDGGAWSETEVLGNVALCKVRASDATLALIAASPNVLSLPSGSLDTTLASLTSGQRNAILSRLQAMGYTLTELNAALGSTLSAWRTKTRRQLLNMIAQRRRKPQSIALDGTVTFSAVTVAPKPAADIDREVQ